MQWRSEVGRPGKPGRPCCFRCPHPALWEVSVHEGFIGFSLRFLLTVHRWLEDRRSEGHVLAGLSDGELEKDFARWIVERGVEDPGAPVVKA